MPTHITHASKHHPVHTRRRTIGVPFGTQRLLAVFEGLEGGFAIGASIVAALALSGLERDVLLITAIITITVSGFNNASVKFSSEHYLDELDGREKKSALRHYFAPALIEFVAYVAISFISILPLLVFQDIATAVLASIMVTIVMLFAAGWWRGYMLHMPKLRDAIETAVLGAGIVAVGAASGYIVTLL